MQSQTTLNEAQLHLINLLLKHQVIFLVIGGHAVCNYSNYRETHDLDILLSKSKGNARRLANAFIHASINPPPGKVWDNILTKSGIRLAYPNDQNKEADLLTSIDGIEFGKCYEISTQIVFETFVVRIPSVLDLIEMKKRSIALGNDIPAKTKDAQDIRMLTTLLKH